MKIKEWLCIITFVAVLTFSTGIIIGSISTRKVVHVDLEINNEQTTVDVPPKYPFLESRVPNYICSLSDKLKIDSDLAVINFTIATNRTVVQRLEFKTNTKFLLL